MTRFTKWLWALFRAIPGEDGISEFQCEEHEPDIQYKTYMFGGGISEWEGTTKWVERR